MAGKGSGKLEVTLPSDKEILLKRVFDAPRHLVWEAMTKPEYVRVWWAAPCEGATMPICDIDFRVGGAYRYVTRMPDGSEFAFSGVYREIVVPERVVHSEIFESYPDETTMVTMTLEERGGKTYFASRVVHKTTEGRDAHIASGMEGGADIALDICEKLANDLAAPKNPPGTERVARA